MLKAKQHYLSNPSCKLDDLPRLFNISISTVFKHAAKERWASNKRNLWKSVSVEKDLECRMSLLMDQASAILTKAFMELDQLYRQYDRLGTEKTLVNFRNKDYVLALMRKGMIEKVTL